MAQKVLLRSNESTNGAELIALRKEENASLSRACLGKMIAF